MSSNLMCSPACVFVYHFFESISLDLGLYGMASDTGSCPLHLSNYIAYLASLGPCTGLEGVFITSTGLSQFFFLKGVKDDDNGLEILVLCLLVNASLFRSR